MTDIKELIDALDVVVKAFRSNGENIMIARDHLSHHNDIEMDFLHKLELEDLSYHEMAQMTKRIKDSRVARREFKDYEYMLVAVEDTYKQPHVSNVVNNLGKLLGSLRAIQQSGEERQYRVRSGVFEKEKKDEKH